MSTVDTMYGQYRFREGMTVYGADGEKVGKVVALDPAYIVVEKGFFFPTDYYIPVTAVASATEDDVYLTVSKEEALHQAWDRLPETTSAYPTDAAYATDLEGRDRVAVPVHEEELQAATRPVDRGKVRIEKDVVTEERAMDVPVTEERVRVRHVPAGGEVPADAVAFEEGVIEVPLRGEEVVVEKHTRRAGEVVVEKEAVQHTERVGGTVRREEVRVDDATVEGAGIVEETGREARS
jgi:uncharacterized protein (TIGR02271 family)